MNEDLLQFVWQYKYLLNKKLITTDGRPLEIIKPGLLNNGSGPDFFNAQIRLSNATWVGNVEVHIKSSDWIKHKHHLDKAYDNVILHVVWEHDTEIINQDGEFIPTLEIKNLLSKEMMVNYQNLMLGNYDIPCSPIFQKLPAVEWTFWIEKLSVERLEKKHDNLFETLNKLNGNWEALLYHQIATAFGQKTNAMPFELLSFQLPNSILAKYTSDLISIQSLVLGTAGFLNKKMSNEYNQTLQNNFNFLSKKHELKCLDNSIWKFGRTRPKNFPTIRLFQFAEWMRTNPSPLSQYIKCNTVKEVKSITNIKGNQQVDIGDLHPNGKETHIEKVSISESFVDSILINAIIPVLFAYGKHNQLYWLCNKVQDWTGEINAEENHITKQWEKLGIFTTNAKESQALIQLKNYYCLHKKCLSCAIGNQLLKPQKEAIC